MKLDENLFNVIGINAQCGFTVCPALETIPPGSDTFVGAWRAWICGAIRLATEKCDLEPFPFMSNFGEYELLEEAVTEWGEAGDYNKQKVAVLTWLASNLTTNRQAASAFGRQILQPFEVTVSRAMKMVETGIVDYDREAAVSFAIVHLQRLVLDLTRDEADREGLKNYYLSFSEKAEQAAVWTKVGPNGKGLFDQFKAHLDAEREKLGKKRLMFISPLPIVEPGELSKLKAQAERLLASWEAM